jgi:hypothetical protein
VEERDLGLKIVQVETIGIGKTSSQSMSQESMNFAILVGY